MMKKVVLMLCAVMCMASTACQASGVDAASKAGEGKVAAANVAAIKFTDVGDEFWGKKDIYTGVTKGYVDGYEDSTFRPELNVSRAEFMKMVSSALKLPITGSTSGSMWFVPYANAAKAAGIYHDEDFPIDEMDKALNRLEMARLSLRATDKTLQNPAMQVDNDSVMYNATKKGIIQGLSRGELGPDKATTRAQSVAIIERILKVQNGETLPTDKYAVSNAELALKKTNIFSVMPEFFGGKQLASTPWNPENLTLDTPDGKFKGVLEQLIAIDLEDPNDPNLALIPDINTLHWFNRGKPTEGPLVKDFTHSYILYFKTSIKNNDPTIYSDYFNYLPLQISGFESPNAGDFESGISLNTITKVFVNQLNDTTAYIIPKTALTNGNIYISINAPAIPANPTHSKKILGVGVSTGQLLK